MKVTPIALFAAGLALVALPATAQQRQPRPDRESATVEQLNEQSLARARAGQDMSGTSVPGSGQSGGGMGMGPGMGPGMGSGMNAPLGSGLSGGMPPAGPGRVAPAPGMDGTGMGSPGMSPSGTMR